MNPIPPMQLTWVETLEEFEIPLMTVSQDPTGAKWIQSWFTQTDDLLSEWWLVFPITDEVLIDYKENRISYRDLLFKCGSPTIRIEAYTYGSKESTFFETTLAELPQDALPLPGYYHSTCPDNNEEGPSRP